MSGETLTGAWGDAETRATYWEARATALSEALDVIARKAARMAESDRALNVEDVWEVEGMARRALGGSP